MKKLNKILFVVIAGLFVAGIVSASLGEYWSTISHIIPRIDSTVDIGSDAKKVRAIWADAFYGDYWISGTGNSMNMQPTGDTDDFFSFKTPADRPTIKREGGKYIYIESSNVNDVGISFRKDADHSGTVNYYKDTNEFGLTSKDPLIFKVCEDYDDYVKICAADNVPELSTVGAADFKINAGGANNLLLNHAGGNVGIGTVSPTEKLEIDYGNLRLNQEPVPSTPSGALAGEGAGNLSNGFYNYRITFVTAEGETEASSRSGNITVTDNSSDGKIKLTNIDTGSSKVIARKIYRTLVNVYFPQNTKYVATLNDNTTTEYVDNTADGALGDWAPNTNSTGGSFYVNANKAIEVSPGATIVGYQAGASNVGLNNTFIGKYSGQNTITGYLNTFLGYNAGNDNTTGSYNTYLGTYAGDVITTGSNNTAMGYLALRGTANTGSYNTAVGQGSLQRTIGKQNIALGSETGAYNTDGEYNVFLGYRAGYGTYGMTSTDKNVFIGYQSGYELETSSSNNVGIGYNAGYNMTTGNNNLLLGYQAGNSITTGTDNIIIGYDEDTPTATTDNHLNIGGLIYGDLSGGSVGIGTTTPDTPLHIYDSSATTDLYIESGGAGLGGRIIIEDTDGAGCTALTTLNGVLTAAVIACP